MWVTVNGYSLVNNVDGDSIGFNSAVSDPLSTFDFHVDDPTRSITLDDFMEVILWDENAVFINSVPPTPAMNYALNPILKNDGFGHVPASWTVSGAIGAWSYPQFQTVLTFNNNALGSSLQYQNTLLTSVKPGQQYMFSVYVAGSGTISNIQSIIKFDWYDVNNNLIAGGPSDIRTPALGQVHISVSATAPATAAYAQLSFGGQTTVNAANSGVITFSTVQFEPMWFQAQGVTYPTFDCNFAQINSILLPDGTTSRQCRIFTGFIDDLEITYEGNQRFYEVKSIANSSLLEDYALINASYTSQYDTFMITDIINTYFSGVISTGQQFQQAPPSTIIQGSLIDQVTHVEQNAAVIEDKFTGDNATTIFNLTKPPFTVHTVTIFDGTNTNKQKTGIYGVDTFVAPSTFVALIDKQRQLLIFKNPPTNSGGANNIVIDYTYEDAVISIVQSGDSYAKYGRWFWRKVNDSNMTSCTAAAQRGIAEATKYAFPAQIPKFTTENLYIPVGSTVLFTSQHDSLNQVAFTVQTVAVSYQGGGVYVYAYTSGRYNPTLIDHFRNTHKALNRPGTTANVAQQIITYDSVLFDTITWNDSVQANPQTALPSGRYGAARYGFSSYG